MRGVGCPKCANIKRNESRKSSVEDVIIDFKTKHGDTYDYSLVDYKTYHEKVSIICKTHGVFNQSPSDHIRGCGCPSCGGLKSVKDRVMSNKDFIKKSKKVHGDKYDYSLSVYVNSNEKVTIICPYHGAFNQAPIKHMDGQGCRLCGIESRTEFSKKNPSGWNVSNWEKASKTSKNFDSFKVYVIRCWSGEEKFYKIGRTFVKTERRFRGKSILPYDYDVLKEFIFNTARDAFNFESQLKKQNKDYKYVPNKPFCGKHECFFKINLDIKN